MIKEIRAEGELCALILSHRFEQPGVHFITGEEFSQQVAYMRHPAGKVIQPHVHLPVERRITQTTEVLIIRSGRLKADFYRQDRTFLQTELLEAGDVLILISGGHGFEVLEEVVMIEVKQGPFAGNLDKVRFAP